MRYDRVQHAQQYAQRVGHALARNQGIGQRGRLERVEHFHARRDDGVVVDTLIIVISLLKLAVNLAAQRFGGRVGSRPIGFAATSAGNERLLRLAKSP